MRVTLRLRLSQVDAHYGGDLVDGARILALFGDAATELLIRNDGDEGLFRAYESVEFLAPVYAGDYLEIHAEMTKVGNTSRQMSFEAFKVISSLKYKDDKSLPSAAAVWEKPQLVVKAKGICVVPLECQRLKKGS